MPLIQRHLLLLIALLLVQGIQSCLKAAEKFNEPTDVEFTAECDGSIQKYVVMLPKGFDENQPHAMMIALHGHGSDRWQYAKDPRSECQAARDVALKFNMVFVSPDYRAKTSWMGPKAEADLVQIIAELKSKHKISKAILVGGSMGGSSSLSFTVLHPNLVDGVVSNNGTANHLEYEGFQEHIQASYGGFKQEIPLEYKRRSAEYWPERLTMPIAITTGGKDILVPPESCIRLATVLKKLNPHLLHIHRPQGGHSTNYEDVATALNFVCDLVLKP